MKTLATDSVLMTGNTDVSRPLFAQAVELVKLQIEEAQQGIVPATRLFPASKREPVKGNCIRLTWEIIDDETMFSVQQKPSA